MKKLLLASTALVATAGVASAQGIELTGMAEMGIYNPNSETSEAQFFTDIDVTFTMSGEADNGLTFGANIDLDESNTGAFEAPATQGGESIFVSFGGATLTMGDTDGALDARVPEMGLAGGSIADDETAHVGFDDADGYGLFDTDSGVNLDGSGDGQIARFDYAYSSFIFSLSAEQIDDGESDATVTYELLDGLLDDLFGTGALPITVDNAGNVYGVGASYAGNVSGIDLNVGIGYQTAENLADTTSIAATAGFANGLSAGLTFARTNLADDLDTAVETTLGAAFDETIDHRGIGIGYEMNALAIGLNYGEYENDDVKLSGYGLAASYDLGGGLELRAGYSQNTVDVDGLGDEDWNTFSLGARMNF